MAKQIKIDSIQKFYQTDLGSLALTPKNKVLREWPFTYALNIENTDQSIIVQGIVDMIIETPQGLIVIDFKTDRITPDQIKERAKLYTPQLTLYAHAASDILKKPVISANLYFLTPARQAKIDTACKPDIDFLHTLYT